MPLLDLVFAAAAVHREHHDPGRVQCSQLLSIKTGACPEDCAYCPQSIHNQTGLETEALMETQAILADAREGVYVTDWLGGNINPTSGDFSYGVRGLEIKGGQLGRPVSEMLITGNIIELFNRLVEVGNDPWMYSSTRSPTMLFEDVQFSGV